MNPNKAKKYWMALKDIAGIDFAVGVPCGVQKYLIEEIEKEESIKNITTARESEAVGVAAGSFLSGKTPLVYLQNSGLLDSMNDVGSLLISYQIPMLFSVTWRGAPGESAPHHWYTGKATKDVLRAFEIPFVVLDLNEPSEVVKIASSYVKRGQSVMILIIRERFNQ